MERNIHGSGAQQCSGSAPWRNTHRLSLRPGSNSPFPGKRKRDASPTVQQEPTQREVWGQVDLSAEDTPTDSEERGDTSSSGDESFKEPAIYAEFASGGGEGSREPSRRSREPVGGIISSAVAEPVRRSREPSQSSGSAKRRRTTSEPLERRIHIEDAIARFADGDALLLLDLTGCVVYGALSRSSLNQSMRNIMARSLA